jgi:hypothetical protein
MLAQQRTSGAICMSGLLDNGCSIEPYFVNRGLLGLMYNNISAAGNQTQRGTILTVVHRWIEWYLAHLNRPDNLGVQGTVYDYKVVAGGIEKPTSSYDSSDSYAATFLSLVSAYTHASGDETAVRGWKDALHIVAGAINATMGQDHLTGAKSNYPIAFTEDNVEVWAGLMDYTRLCQSIGDLRQGSFANSSAMMSRLAITKLLWSEPSADWFVNKGAGAANWSTFYPDAQAQLWPALVEFHSAQLTVGAGQPTVNGDHGCSLLAGRFAATQGNAWSKLQVADIFPHAMLALPLVRCGQNGLVAKFLESVRHKFFPAMVWPWHIAEAGGFVAGAQALLSSAVATQRV